MAQMSYSTAEAPCSQKDATSSVEKGWQVHVMVES